MFNDKKISASKTLIDLLNIHPSLRTLQDIELISFHTKHYKFFEDLSEKDETLTLHTECCKVLTVQLFPRGEYVCKKGDPGDAFYLILKGTLSIISDENYVGNSEQGAENFLIKFSNKEVAVLNAGQSFGEMALINDRPRYFSVKCLESTILAVLHKEDYKIIAKIQEKQINEKVDFIKALPPFKNWTRIAVQKLSYFFKSYSFKKGNNVYSEGDSPTDVYIIRSGEFIFTQKYSFDADRKAQAESFGTLSKRKAEKIVKIKKTLKVVIKQKGEIFGYNEILENLPGREFTCMCLSNSGELLVITDKNFAKKVAHPETLKIIEQSCFKFKEWLSPRMESLRKVEKLKDQMSFTPLSKIKIVKNESDKLRMPVLYSPSPMRKTNPTVLEKFLSKTRTVSFSHRKTKLDNATMFPTEVNRSRILERKIRLNLSINNNYRIGG